MNITDAYNLIHAAMDKHGLFVKGWSFEWDRSKRRFGLCQFSGKHIKMSHALCSINEESEVLDTILHEIAHALVGPGHSHGNVWKLKAIEIGARPEACYSLKKVNSPEPTYTGTCSDCGLVVPRYKRPRPSMIRSGYHPACKYKARRGKLVWRMRGVLMIAPPIVLGKPLWQRQQAAHAPTPTPEVKAGLSQADINEVWAALQEVKKLYE